MSYDTLTVFVCDDGFTKPVGLAANCPPNIDALRREYKTCLASLDGDDVGLGKLWCPDIETPELNGFLDAGGIDFATDHVDALCIVTVDTTGEDWDLAWGIYRTCTCESCIKKAGRIGGIYLPFMSKLGDPFLHRIPDLVCTVVHHKGRLTFKKIWQKLRNYKNQ